MKAMVLTQYGSPDVLQLKEIEKPVPKDNEVLIRVHATTVLTADCELRGLKTSFVLRLPLRLWLGFTKPRIHSLGQELAGEIEAVGKDVTRYRVGDAILAWTGLRLGAYAEYTCLSEKAVITIKPSNMTYEEAATLAVGGLEAAHLIRRGHIQSGEQVLINGAGGSIGTYAIQLARHLGGEVTGVDSADKLDTMRAIGAEHVIDYAREDFTRNGQTYDVIFDVVGKSSFSRSIRSLKPNGRYLLGNPNLSQNLQGHWTPLRNGQQVIFRTSGQARGDLAFLKALVEAGSIKAVIDRQYSLEQLAEAHRYVESGQKKGSVVITV